MKIDIVRHKTMQRGTKEEGGKKAPDWGPNYSTTDSMTGRIQCPVALLILLSCQASGTFHDS